MPAIGESIRFDLSLRLAIFNMNSHQVTKTPRHQDTPQLGDTGAIPPQGEHQRNSIKRWVTTKRQVQVTITKDDRR